MEHGGSSNNFQRLPKSSSGMSNDNTPDLEDVVCEHDHEEDHSMPIGTVLRIMRKILPSHAEISNDAKDTIQDCVSEFISFVTSEANERCKHEQRKTIIAEDVLWAMNKLGFDEYVEPLTMYINRYREHESRRGLMQVKSVKRPVEIAPSPVQSYPPRGFPIAHPFREGMFVRPRMGGPYMNPNQAPNNNFDGYPPFK